MPLRRKKKTVRDTLENTYDQVRHQVAEKAPALRDQVVDQVATKAPVVRDQVVAKLEEGRDELRTRLPELHQSLFERLPDDVADRLPEGAKPKKKKSKLKKLAIVGLVAAAGGFVYSKLKGGSSAPTYAPPTAPTAPDRVDLTKPGPTPVPDAVDEIADGAAPDAVK